MAQSPNPRTALFSRNAQGAIVIADQGISTGQRFWVDSATGTDGSGYGMSPDKPFATLDYAIGKVTEDNGDVIYLMPGHAENLTAADTVDCDVSGFTVIGLGSGSLIPTFSATVEAGSITIDDTNITLKNIKLVCNYTGGSTTAITWTANGDGCTLDGVQFRDTANTKEWLIHVSVATTVTDGTIKNCSMVGLAGGSTTNSILFAGTSANFVIEGNHIFVDSSDSVIDHATGASVNLVVRRNVIINADTDAAGYCVENKSDGTGVVHDNRMGYNKNNAEMTAGAATFWFENYVSNTITESGLLDPATSHAIP